MSFLLQESLKKLVKLKKQRLSLRAMKQINFSNKYLCKRSATTLSGLAVAAVCSVTMHAAHAKTKLPGKKTPIKASAKASFQPKVAGILEPEVNFSSKGKAVQPFSAAEQAALGKPTTLHMPSEIEQQASFQQGTASWYGPGFHNRLTANGERFDMHAMTAAHRTLPFGTMVLVKNPATGKSVTVRINDRGPYVKGRIIDLSRAAAQKLGISGIQHVVLFHQKAGSGKTPKAKSAIKINS